MKRLPFFIVILLFTKLSNAQVIISLLLGDDLNTGKIEFGLDGGIGFSNLDGIEKTDPHNHFHLGFYFDISMKDPWKFHTGVIVKSVMGAEGITPYSTGDSTVDELFSNGNVERKLDYFNVPAMIKYNFKCRIYAEGGIMLGLKYGARDNFVIEENDDRELTHTIKNKALYNPIDAGLIAGVGWRIIKGYGMNLGLRYYWGLTDITKDDDEKIFNRNLYLALGIPIGVGKARAKAKEKE